MKEEDREFLTLTGEDGEETEFEIVDKIVVNGTEYLALVPAVESDEDGLYIYKVIVEDGDEYIEPIEDDEEFEEISETFEDRLSEIYDFE
jgi:uncharacterized protein YrzB (UPF0473 family)